MALGPIKVRLKQPSQQDDTKNAKWLQFQPIVGLYDNNKRWSVEKVL